MNKEEIKRNVWGNGKSRIINVYLTLEDKKKLNEIRDNNHISYSTIVQILFEHLGTGKNLMIWQDHYYYKDEKSYKTSIKPRCCKEGTYYSQSIAMTIVLTNIIKAFTRNEIEKITGMSKTEVEKARSRIYNDFKNTFDPNWNGNEFIHRTAKIFKQNPNYWSKLLGKE